MTTNLNNIPAELQVSIFGFCEDLDDAVCLSQVCRHLRQVFQIDQRRIETRIITSSHVHEYDFCLSKLLALRDSWAPLYRNLGKQLPEAHRPSITVFENCLRAEDNKAGATGAEIQQIVLRWKRFSFLRGLYADDDVSQDFDRFRTAYVSDRTPDEWATIVMPGLNSGSIKTSHVNRVQFVQNKRFASDFKARFHKILCLHSMAVTGVHFAKISKDEAESEQKYNDVAETIDHLWIKKGVLVGGKRTDLDLDSQLDGIEVYDFLYMFLLRKILPYYNLTSWTGHDAGEYPLITWNDELETGDWYWFLRQCRQVLQPDDLLGLIENGAWRGPSSGPPNKSMYLRVRGMFERAYENELDFDFDRAFERTIMVKALFTSFDERGKTQDEPYVWDHVRLRLGSPFLKNSSHRYRIEIDEVNQEMEKEKGNG